MSDNGLEFNKLTGAVLLAGVIAMIAGLTSEALYAGGAGEHGEEAKRGYSIEVAQNTASTGGAPAVEEKPIDIAPLLAKADVKAGEALIKKCTACHTFNDGGKNGVGPNQWGIFENHFAHKSDYTYSAALMAMKDRKWTAQNLSEFLTAPKKYMPGNKMSFAGIPKPEDRANLIAYLATLK